MRDQATLAEQAAALIQAHTDGLTNTQLVDMLSCGYEDLTWALYNHGREHGVGQARNGRWYHINTNPEVKTRHDMECPPSHWPGHTQPAAQVEVLAQWLYNQCATIDLQGWNNETPARQERWRNKARDALELLKAEATNAPEPAPWTARELEDVAYWLDVMRMNDRITGTEWSELTDLADKARHHATHTQGT
jgi:hypothetical protein